MSIPDDVKKTVFAKLTYLWLIAGTALVGITVASVSLIMLYQTAYDETLKELEHSANTLSGLLEAVTQFDMKHSSRDIAEGPKGATLSQIRQGLKNYHKTFDNKELNIAWQEGEEIILLQRNRNNRAVDSIELALGYDMESPALKYALEGKYGSGEFVDFKGRLVLSGYAPVPSLKAAVIYKIELREVQAPYLKTAYRVGVITFLLVILGGIGFSFFVLPIQKRADSATQQALQHQEELRASEDRLRRVIDATNDGIWDWDLLLNSISMSERCREILGYKVEELQITEQVFMQLVHRDDRERLFEAVLQHFKYNECFQIELRLCHQDGDYRWILCRGEGLRDDEGRVIRMLGTITDISLRKQAEAELDRHRQHLEEMVSERTLALQETQSQLMESEKMATLVALVAGVAHELNTPVGVSVTANSFWQSKLAVFAERFRENALTREDFESMLASAEESSQIIEANLNRAADLVRSFKQVAVDQASNELRHFNLQEYLQEIRLSLQPKLKKGKYRVDIDCPTHITLYSNPGGLSQVLTNLIMNSLIHGFADSEEGNIHIQVNDLNKSRIQIFYKDDGKGIPSEYLSKIFNQFFTTRRGQGGSGLGMHIVYNLVTQTLGGTITCSSNLGEGTTFVIVIPLQAEEKEDWQIKEANG